MSCFEAEEIAKFLTMPLKEYEAFEAGCGPADCPGGKTKNSRTIDAIYAREGKKAKLEVAIVWKQAKKFFNVKKFEWVEG